MFNCTWISTYLFVLSTLAQPAAADSIPVYGEIRSLNSNNVERTGCRSEYAIKIAWRNWVGK